METHLIFYFIAFLGVLFHLGIKYRDSFTKKIEFDWKYQGIFSIFSLMTAFILIAFKPSISPFLPESFASLIDNYLAWFIIAYFSDSVWKNVENTGKNRLDLQSKKISKKKNISDPPDPPVGG